MYTSFFGLQEKPFAITPDPRYLYLSERHAEALAHLLYGINEAGGFIQLTGEVGTGKTTIIRSLLEQLPAHADVALILNPRVTPAEFLLTICEELRIPVPEPGRGSVKLLMDLIGRRLLDTHARGRRVVLIVDEAQNLSAHTLEQVRLLTNLETATTKLLQIILIGQPELRDLLARPELRQLAQRITARYHLNPLSSEETAGYVKHRMRVAGATAEAFTPASLAEVHRLSGGVPRIINVICDRALLGAFTHEDHRVSGKLVREAAAQVYGRPMPAPWLRWAIVGSIAAALALVAAGLWSLLASRPPASTDATAADAAPVASNQLARAETTERTAASAAVLRRGARPTWQRHDHRGCARQAVCVLGRNLRSERRPRLRPGRAARVSNACSRRARGPSFEPSTARRYSRSPTTSAAPTRCCSPALGDETATIDLGGESRSRVDRRDVALLVRRFPAPVASAARRREGARAWHARGRRALAAGEPARRAGPAGRARRQ